jgi:hypothetical protein
VSALGQVIHQYSGLVLAIGHRVRSEFDQQPGAAIWQGRLAPRADALEAHVFEQHSVEAFESDRVVLHDHRHRGGGDVDVFVAEHQKAPDLRARHQANQSLEHGDAGAFGTHQSSRHVEAVLGQQLVQVIAGNAPGDFGEAFADLIAIGVAHLHEALVDLAPASASGDDPDELLGRSRPHVQDQSVVSHDLEPFDVVRGEPGHDRVDAARVVADHPAQRAPVVGRRVGAEGELVALGRSSQGVEDDPGLDSRSSRGRVEIDDVAHVLREIEDERHVARLAGQAGPPTSRQDGDAELSPDGNCRDGVSLVHWKNDSDRNVTVVGRVNRIERTAGGVEAHLAADLTAQCVLESLAPVRAEVLRKRRHLRKVKGFVAFECVDGVVRPAANSSSTNARVSIQRRSRGERAFAGYCTACR